MELSPIPLAERHSKRKAKAAAWSVVTCLSLVVLKLGIGILTGSIGIVSEAAHSGADLVAAAMAFFAVRTAAKPADRDHPYGHGKYESLSGAIEALLIFAAVGWIVYAAIKRLMHGGELAMLGLGTGVMALSVCANFLVSANLFRVAKVSDSLALEADAWHHQTDAITSAGIGIGMIVMWISPKLWWIDPIGALLVAILILKAATDLTRVAVRQILDSALPPAEQKLIEELLKEHYGDIVNFHRLRTRKSGAERQLDLHVVMPRDMTVAESHELCDHLESDIDKMLPGTRTLIHVEPERITTPPKAKEQSKK